MPEVQDQYFVVGGLVPLVAVLATVGAVLAAVSGRRRLAAVLGVIALAAIGYVVIWTVAV